MPLIFDKEVEHGFVRAPMGVSPGRTRPPVSSVACRARCRYFNIRRCIMLHRNSQTLIHAFEHLLVPLLADICEKQVKEARALTYRAEIVTVRKVHGLHVAGAVAQLLMRRGLLAHHE